jgi:hypothetical protein
MSENTNFNETFYKLNVGQINTIMKKYKTTTVIIFAYYLSNFQEQITGFENSFRKKRLLRFPVRLIKIKFNILFPNTILYLILRLK